MRNGLLVLLVFSLLALARRASAHDPFEATTTARVRSTTIELEVTMASATALRLAGSRGGSSRDLSELGPELYRVDVDGERLAARASSVSFPEPNEVAYHVVYDAPSPGRLALVADHVVELGEGYTSALALSRDDPPGSLGFRVLTAAEPSFSRELRARAAPNAAAASAPSDFGSFFRLGVEHILEGYDHLLFLAGLLIAARGLRSVLLLISAFTVSHSVTLGLSALGWLSLPTVVVEAIIAASIVVVGAENLWCKGEPRHRVALVFAFGLVHGLGFAGALQEATRDSASGELLVRLLGFNLGVEAGQLGLGLVSLPLLHWAKQHRFGHAALAAASVVIGLTGTYLLAERSLLS